MAWTAPRTWVAAETLTAALLNTHVRDNMLETAVAKVTTAGDLTYATGANALTRLAIGSANAVLVSTGSAPRWSSTGVTASAGVAYNAILNNTLTAAANSDVLGAAQIYATIASGTYTGLTAVALYLSGLAKTGTGTVSTAYGLLLTAPTIGTTNWAIYGDAGDYRLGGTSSRVFIGDTSNANQTAGLTINQGSATNEIIALKNSAVAHGVTGVAETDTICMFKRRSAMGGIEITGVSNETGGPVLQDPGVRIVSVSGYALSAKSTTGFGVVEVNARDATGALSANENIISFANNDTVRFILDADGDSHQDVGTSWTNYDDRDDVAALNVLSAHLTRADDPLRRNFAEWLEHDRAPLEAARIVTFNEDGHHFINWSRANMLVIGAVRQMADKMAATLARLEAAEAKLSLLEA